MEFIVEGSLQERARFAEGMASAEEHLRRAAEDGAPWRLEALRGMQSDLLEALGSRREQGDEDGHEYLRGAAAWYGLAADRIEAKEEVPA